MKRYFTKHSEMVYRGITFDVRCDTVELPTGSIVKRDIVTHSGAVVIVPKTADGKLILVRQYRHAIGDHLLEFPAGTIELGEAPLVCAKREIIEEAKHSAASWYELGKLYPAPGFADELQHLYVAWDLTPDSAALDEDEIIEPVAYSIEAIRDLIRSEKLIDAKSIAAFYRAELAGLL